MLVIDMKDQGFVQIGDRVKVIVQIRGGKVKLCIDAPKDVQIRRDAHVKLQQELGLPR